MTRAASKWKWGTGTQGSSRAAEAESRKDLESPERGGHARFVRETGGGNATILPSRICPHYCFPRKDKARIENVLEAQSGPSNRETTARNFHVFDLKLYAPFKQSLVLFGIDADLGESRWVVVHTKTGRDYKVYIKNMDNYHILTIGWELVAVREGIQEEDYVRFTYVEHSCFILDTRRAHNHINIDGVGPPNMDPFEDDDYYLAKDMELTPPIREAMQLAWSSVRQMSPMYVCALTKSQASGPYMFFSTEYSAYLPDKKNTVALRFLGSPVAICVTIRKSSRNGWARISKGWQLFVAEHKLSQGDVLVFRCYRGPTAWEIFSCRA